MSKTSIAWTNRTWNPVTGCTKYSAGCQHCYAEVMAKRLQGMGQKRYANAFELTLHPEALNEPKKVKEPSMFFVCSMSDLFHKDVPDEFIDKVIQVIKDCPQHTFQLLTKRTERMYEYFYFNNDRVNIPPNVWIGTTVENQLAVRRIPWLAEIKSAPVRFLSCEPLLSDLKDLDLFNIDWVIVGGESGNQRVVLCAKCTHLLERKISDVCSTLECDLPNGNRKASRDVGGCEHFTPKQKGEAG